MQLSLLLASALGVSVWAAPAFPNIEAIVPDNIQALSEYFNLLASKVQESRGMAMAPVCDLSAVALPPGAADLPQPAPGLTLKHIAIGRGTQNYTCDAGDATAAPKAVGALATLFNASCAAAIHPDLVSALARASLHFSVQESESKLAPSNLAVSGVHYFSEATTAFFNLDVSSSWKIGEIPCGKNASVPAPVDAQTGLANDAAVAWLKLNAKPGATRGLREVYRVETIGGSPPATCRGLPAHFEVQYATQYWFYAE
ncbi:Malate dehydrogenase [Madurella fahalii]|uniref:Malate dehydrogenase n=1 Tax=Madurella fahalii TaxID=1157608 RepID=A0ABQ0GAY3_9PEZI